MSREYMDEQYLKVLQDFDDEDREKATQNLLAEEIATQDIQGGQATVNGQVVKFAPRALLEGKITIHMPEEWSDMEPDLVKLKYPYEARPSIILTDETTLMNFTVNHIPQALKPEELEQFKNAMKNFTGKMTKAQFNEDGMLQEPDGFDKSWFDFVVPSLVEEIYNLMFFASLNQRALLMTFNCLKEDEDRWKPIVFDMMKTMKPGSPNNTRQTRRMVW